MKHATVSEWASLINCADGCISEHFKVCGLPVSCVHDQKGSLNLYQLCQISSKPNASLTDVKGQLQQLHDCITLFFTACKDLRGSPTDMGPAACQLSY